MLPRSLWDSGPEKRAASQAQKEWEEQRRRRRGRASEHHSDFARRLVQRLDTQEGLIDALKAEGREDRDNLRRIREMLMDLIEDDIYDFVQYILEKKQWQSRKSAKGV